VLQLLTFICDIIICLFRWIWDIRSFCLWSLCSHHGISCAKYNIRYIIVRQNLIIKKKTMPMKHRFSSQDKLVPSQLKFTFRY